MTRPEAEPPGDGLCLQPTSLQWRPALENRSVCTALSLLSLPQDVVQRSAVTFSAAPRAPSPSGGAGRMELWSLSPVEPPLKLVVARLTQGKGHTLVPLGEISASAENT